MIIPHEGFASSRVLFVEDDAIMCQKITELLEIFFKEVFVARDGVEGLELYEKHYPDIIVSDISMPKMTGIELVNIIREKNKKIALVLLSSHSESEILLEAINAGIDSYVLKPVNLEKLLSALNKAFDRYSETETIVTLSESTSFNLNSLELHVNQSLVKLGRKEQELLKYFIQNRKTQLSKEQIISHIWPLDEITDSAFKSLLYRLRKKIDHNNIINVQENSWRFQCLE